MSRATNCSMDLFAYDGKIYGNYISLRNLLIAFLKVDDTYEFIYAIDSLLHKCKRQRKRNYYVKVDDLIYAAVKQKTKKTSHLEQQIVAFRAGNKNA